jgi:hypothetical protein
MAERIVSPGVFTNEVDQSFLAGGVAQIGAAIVGPTQKGPALIPTPVRSYQEFVATFGSYTDESYVPFVVEDYLRQGGGVITVTRLLYEDGYKLTNGALAVIAKSGSTQIVTHVLHPTQAVTTTGATALFENSLIQDAGSGNFAIKISGSYAAGADSAIGFDGSFLVSEGVAISGSIVQTSNKYLSKVFGNSPKSIDYPVYVQYENPTAYGLFNNLSQVTTELAILSNYEFLQDYQTAVTPWITSQKIGSVVKNLLRFHTLSHGDNVNYETKVAIRDVKASTEVSDPNGYPTFTVEVRRVNTANIPNSVYGLISDTDSSPAVESFLNVNLDPTSPRYIARVIGDRYQSVTNDGDLVISGDYPNQSRYIRVEVTEGVTNKTNDKTLFPFGFRAPLSTIPNASGSLNLRAAQYVTSQAATGQFSINNFFGFNFGAASNMSYLGAIPTSGSTTGSRVDF